MDYNAKGVLKQMIEVYKPNGFDWMNCALAKKNKYTYHHTTEKKNGGKATIENGSILTIWSHRFLNFLEIACPDAYEDLQNIFRHINASRVPMTPYFINEVDLIIYNIFNGGYRFSIDVDLEKLYNSDYLKYYCNRAKLKEESTGKKLEKKLGGCIR